VPTEIVVYPKVAPGFRTRVAISNEKSTTTARGSGGLGCVMTPQAFRRGMSEYSSLDFLFHWHEIIEFSDYNGDRLCNLLKIPR
jgi:hypothetical protein